LDTAQTITIYKATQKGKGQSLLKQCYFAAPNSRNLAEEYHRYYKDGILEVTIASETYTQYFKPP
jgi:hypothetical protein